MGFGALGAIAWQAMDVLAARALIFQALVDETALPIGRQRRLEKQVAKLFPSGTASFKEVGALQERVDAEYQKVNINEN